MNDVFPHYDRAPLTEAVIELRCAKAYDSQTLASLHRRFTKLGWKQEELLELEVKLGMPKVEKRHVGHKYTSPNGDKIIQVSLTSVACSVTAPYPGWENFVSFLFESYATWRKETSGALGRIGVRYINRFDVPCTEGAHVNFQDYVALNTSIPPQLDAPPASYSVTISSGIQTDLLDVTITSARLNPSPLVDSVSLLLDIDLSRSIDVPQNEANIRILLDLIRLRRTEIFEQCLTPASRALIS